MLFKKDKRTFEIVESRFEAPMVLATLTLLIIIILRGSFDLPYIATVVFDLVDFFIWVLFVIELSILTYLSPKPLSYLKTHWYNVLIVFLPFMRVVRLFRISSLVFFEGALMGIQRALILLFGADTLFVRVIPLIVRSINELKDLVRRNRLDYVIYIILLVVVFLGSLGAVFEKNSPDANITSIPEGIWWGLVSISTVGYGDYYPITIQGRIIGFILITIGVVLFSLLVAKVSSNMVEDHEEIERKNIQKRLSNIEKTLENIEDELKAKP